MQLFFFLALFTGEDALSGTWYGAIEVPGQPLEIEIVLFYEGEKLKGHISIPIQGLHARKLRCKLKKNGKLTLAINGIPGDPLFMGKIKEGQFSGDFTQGGGSFPFKLEKGKKPGVEGNGNQPPLTPAVKDHPALGHWEGHVVVPGQQPLVTWIDFRFQNDHYQGRAKFPSQAEKYFPISRIDFNGNELAFQIPSIPGVPSFQGVLKDGKVSGNYQQGALKSTFELSRESAPVGNRPQMPKGPFPYAIEDFTWTNGDITLAGTLTIPEGDGPFPAIILLTGSGTQDRDSTLLGHKPFWVIADALTRRGIAVLRYDDRGTGGSTGDPNSTTADFARDALAGVQKLAQHGKIDRKHIGLVGHSEGGIIAPLAASQSGDVAFIVSLAGTGTTGRAILDFQLNRQFKTLYDQDQQQALKDWLDQFLDIVAKSGSPQEAREQADPLLAKMHEALPESIKSNYSLNDYRNSMNMFFFPWTQWFLNHNPTDSLKVLKIPVLVMLCELDKQVTIEQNLEPIKAALANNPLAEVRVMSKLNHLFQPAITGEGDEYSKIEITFDENALKDLGDWILRQSKP